jgi:glycerol-3-phosphate O-acyltransferase / dihydroxyacetone phosphate acyltransferase
MLYSFFKGLFQITVKVFFRSFVVRGAEHEPAKGPLIIVVNHPSTFMDPIVVGAVLKRRIHFLAKAEVFKSGFSKWFFPKLNMIPVYRAQDDPNLLHKNKETFAKCYEHLGKGGVILIFPEGISLTERKLRKIKTGAARIALGAEELHGFKLGVKILSIGLNYSNPHKFQSDLLIDIEPPINVSDYREKYLQNEREAANELTEEIRIRLERQIIAIEDDHTEKIVSNVEKIFKAQVLKDLGHSVKDTEQDVAVTKRIAHAVSYFMEVDPARVERLKFEMDRYLDNLDRLQISHSVLGKFVTGASSIGRRIITFFYFILGLPVFIFGFVNNYLPFKLPYWIAKRVTDKIEYIGSLTMVGGTFIFAIFYATQGWLIQRIFHEWWFTLAYMALLPISGLFAFGYWKRFTNLRGRWIILSLFSRKTVLVSSLIHQREEIIKDLERSRQEFVEKHPAVVV